jgi:hypothetical protein
MLWSQWYGGRLDSVLAGVDAMEEVIEVARIFLIAYSRAAAFPTVSRTIRLLHERGELVSLLGVCSHLCLIWSVAKACAAASLNLQSTERMGR